MYVSVPPTHEYFDSNVSVITKIVFDHNIYVPLFLLPPSLFLNAYPSKFLNQCCIKLVVAFVCRNIFSLHYCQSAMPCGRSHWCPKKFNWIGLAWLSSPSSSHPFSLNSSSSKGARNRLSFGA